MDNTLTRDNDPHTYKLTMLGFWYGWDELAGAFMFLNDQADHWGNVRDIHGVERNFHLYKIQYGKDFSNAKEAISAAGWDGSGRWMISALPGLYPLDSRWLFAVTEDTGTAYVWSPFRLAWLDAFDCDEQMKNIVNANKEMEKVN